MSIESIVQGYQIKQELGSGSFCIVYKAIELSTKKFVALKKINKISQRQSKSILNEIQLMQRLNHPNILKFLDSFKQKQRFYIVLQYCENGDLQNFYKNHGAIPQKIAKSIILQILYALVYLHDNKIVHRDLKPANILIDHKFHIKLADFGFSKDYQADGMKTYCGTPITMAPQILRSEQYNSTCDTWSLGVISYAFLCGDYPFKPKNKNGNVCQQLKKIIMKCKRPVFPQKLQLSSQAKSFIQSCLTINMNNRPSIKQLLNHKWLQNPIKDDVRYNFMKNSIEGISEIVQKTQRAIQYSLKNHIIQMVNLYHISENQITQTLDKLKQLYPENVYVQFIYLLSMKLKNSELESKQIKLKIEQKSLSIKVKNIKVLRIHCQKLSEFIISKINYLKLSKIKQDFTFYQKNLIAFICQQFDTYLSNIEQNPQIIKLLLMLSTQLNSNFQSYISIQNAMKKCTVRENRQFDQYNKYIKRSITEQDIVKLVNDQYQHYLLDYNSDQITNEWTVNKDFINKQKHQSYWAVLDIIKRTLQVILPIQTNQITQSKPYPT